MSHESPSKNKQQIHPKVHFQQYLYNSGEPLDDISKDSRAEFDDELLEINSRINRRRFRDIAQILRIRY